jgi:hypothetical protein
MVAVPAGYDDLLGRLGGDDEVLRPVSNLATLLRPERHGMCSHHTHFRERALSENRTPHQHVQRTTRNWRIN